MSNMRLSEEAREERNKSISDSIKRTRAKRALQKASVFQLKIVDNHLNRKQREASAERMVQEGFKLIPAEHRDFKPVETMSDWNVSSLTFKHLSVKPEAYTLRA